MHGNLLLLDTLRVLSETEDKAIEICPTRTGKEAGCQRASAYNGLFQIGTRVAEIRALEFVVSVRSLERAHIFGLLTSVIKIYCFLTHVRIKIFSLFNFEHVGSNIEV